MLGAFTERSNYIESAQAYYWQWIDKCKYYVLFYRLESRNVKTKFYICFHDLVMVKYLKFISENFFFSIRKYYVISFNDGKQGVVALAKNPPV